MKYLKYNGDFYRVLKEDEVGYEVKNLTSSNNISHISREAEFEVIPEELNLSDLLKGHSGEKFFSYSHGEAKLLRVYNSTVGYDLDLVVEDGDSRVVVSVLWNGKRFKSGLVDLFPSLKLLQDYIFDPVIAWMVWKEK